VPVAHNRVQLALHQLTEGHEGHKGHGALLLLHGLGERTPVDVPPEVAGWTGAVWGLDFTGHGESTVPDGGGYTCELLMADVDLALAQLGAATLVGRGLGGYVGLLVAGARPTAVNGLVIGDGPGLAGGSPDPSTVTVSTVDPDDAGAAPPDPYALQELSGDVRPPDYAASYAREAVRQSGLDRPLVVTALERPQWLAALADDGLVAVEPLDEALARFARGAPA
jgi:pimeloyl-ACP methyl ester carboxylesterase